MILAMMVGYIVILHLIFNVFKLVNATTRNKIYVTVLGCFLIYCVLLFINYYQPMSTDLRVVRFVVPLRTRLQGTVVDVPAKPNLPLKKGDVIFRIDPRPFQTQVDRLGAALAEAEQNAKMLPVDLAARTAAVAGAKAALVDAQQQAEGLEAALAGAKATVAKLVAQRELAQIEYQRGIAIRSAETGAISLEELDNRRLMLEAAKAAVTEAEARQEQAQLAYGARIGDVNTVVVRAEEALREAEAGEARARLALESTIDDENTTVARLRAELAAAEVDLADTVVRAPADGHVTNLALRPGQSVVPREIGVVTFVNEDEYAVAASFHQQVLGVIQPGDAAEIAMDDLPGRTLKATVKNVNWGIPQGQVAASGELFDSTPLLHGRFFVQFALDDDTGLKLPAGEAGAAAVYTSQGRAWIPVRKVFFRWYTWLNYIITDMDVVGPRQ